MKYKLLTISVLTVMLAGCGDDAAQQAKLTNPDITKLGTFDGCEVKYVDRGYESNSFYMAKCGNTVTQSSLFQSGKIQERMTSITQQMDALTAEKQALATREEALNKLTPEERAALIGAASDAAPQ
jgi:uncharacterized lipoprotein YehR (DUF1307 family)